MLFVALTFCIAGAYVIYRWAKCGFETEMLELQVNPGYFIGSKERQ